MLNTLTGDEQPASSMVAVVAAEREERIAKARGRRRERGFVKLSPK